MAKAKPKANRGSVINTILNALESGDKYGYEIIKEVEKNSGVILKQPSLYSSLTRLESQKLISSYWTDSAIGGRRHYYKLTENGQAFLDSKKATENVQQVNLEIATDNAKPLVKEMSAEPSVKEAPAEQTVEPNKQVAPTEAVNEQPEPTEAVNKQPALTEIAEIDVETSIVTTEINVGENEKNQDSVEITEQQQDGEINHKPEDKNPDIINSEETSDKINLTTAPESISEPEENNSKNDAPNTTISQSESEISGRFLQAHEHREGIDYVIANIEGKSQREKRKKEEKAKAEKVEIVQQTLLEIIEENGIKKIKTEPLSLKESQEIFEKIATGAELTPEAKIITVSKVEKVQAKALKAKEKASIDKMLAQKIENDRKLKLADFKELNQELGKDGIKVKPYIKSYFNDVCRHNMYYPNKVRLIANFMFVLLCMCSMIVSYFVLKKTFTATISKQFASVSVVVSVILTLSIIYTAYRYTDAKDKLIPRPQGWTRIFAKAVLSLVAYEILSVIIIIVLMRGDYSNYSNFSGYIIPMLLLAFNFPLVTFLKGVSIKKT